MGNYEIYPLPMIKIRLSEGYLTYFMNYDVIVEAIVYAWFIKGPSKNILIDTSCPMDVMRAHRPDCEEIMSFDDALGKLHLSPDDIDIVIQTQLHYDHVGNTARCKNASVIVQKKELQFGLAPHPVMAGLYHKEMFSRLKLHIVEGDVQIDEGLRLVYTPGHSPGGQSVVVSTAKGDAVITGFCCNKHAFELPPRVTGYTVESLDKLEAMWPVRAPGIHLNALEAFDSTLKVKGLADIIIPNHDVMFEHIEKIPY